MMMVSYARGVSLTPTSDPIRVSKAMEKYQMKKKTNSPRRRREIIRKNECE